MNMWWRCNTCIGPDWLAIHSALMSAIVGPFAIRLPSWPSSSPVVHVLSHSTRNWFYFFYDRSSNDCDLIFVPFAVTNNILVDFGIWFATRAQIYRLLMRLIDVRFICIFFFCHSRLLWAPIDRPVVPFPSNNIELHENAYTFRNMSNANGLSVVVHSAVLAPFRRTCLARRVLAVFFCHNQNMPHEIRMEFTKWPLAFRSLHPECYIFLSRFCFFFVHILLNCCTPAYTQQQSICVYPFFPLFHFFKWCELNNPNGLGECDDFFLFFHLHLCVAQNYCRLFVVCHFVAANERIFVVVLHVSLKNSIRTHQSVWPRNYFLEIFFFLFFFSSAVHNEI